MSRLPSAIWVSCCEKVHSSGVGRKVRCSSGILSSTARVYSREAFQRACKPLAKYDGQGGAAPARKKASGVSERRDRRSMERILARRAADKVSAPRTKNETLGGRRTLQSMKTYILGI